MHREKREEWTKKNENAAVHVETASISWLVVAESSKEITALISPLLRSVLRCTARASPLCWAKFKIIDGIVCAPKSSAVAGRCGSVVRVGFGDDGDGGGGSGGVIAGVDVYGFDHIRNGARGSIWTLDGSVLASSSSSTAPITAMLSPRMRYNPRGSSFIGASGA